MHQSEYYLELLKLFALPPQRYPISNSEKRNRLAVIHPGASKMERAWHLERFAEIAGNLKDAGFEVIFITGDRIPGFDFPVLVKPRLTEFAALLKECAVFIGNDSGPLHLAQQCGAKVVGIYGPGDPKITGLRDVSQGETIFHFFPCSPCRQRFFTECSPSENGKPFCIETITTSEVWRAVEKILKDGHIKC
jgi:ADP-heptose:LPS heptosyltransferase